MEFRTIIPIQPLPELRYDQHYVLLGSCFAEYMSDYLRDYKFSVTINPYGVLFSPTAIARALLEAAYGVVQDAQIRQVQDRWVYMYAHSDWDQTRREDLLAVQKHQRQVLREGVAKAKWVQITLGTAWVYIDKASEQFVANCHKIPQQQFEKHLLGVDEIEAQLRKIEYYLTMINPEVEIIYTISPVRHAKDGWIENQRSKAHLIAGLHQYLNGREKVHYFPSYEIVMDELRDYRFFERDMLHPNDQARAYIWERFCQASLKSSTYDLMQEVQWINRALAHRPFNETSPAHQQFLDQVQQRIENLRTKLPQLQF